MVPQNFAGESFMLVMLVTADGQLRKPVRPIVVLVGVVVRFAGSGTGQLLRYGKFAEQGAFGPAGTRRREFFNECDEHLGATYVTLEHAGVQRFDDFAAVVADDAGGGFAEADKSVATSAFLPGFLFLLVVLPVFDHLKGLIEIVLLSRDFVDLFLGQFSRFRHPAHPSHFTVSQRKKPRETAKRKQQLNLVDCVGDFLAFCCRFWRVLWCNSAVASAKTNGPGFPGPAVTGFLVMNPV